MGMVGGAKQQRPFLAYMKRRPLLCYSAIINGASVCLHQRRVLASLIARELIYATDFDPTDINRSGRACGLTRGTCFVAAKPSQIGRTRRAAAV